MLCKFGYDCRNKLGTCQWAIMAHSAQLLLQWFRGRLESWRCSGVRWWWGAFPVPGESALGHGDRYLRPERCRATRLAGQESKCGPSSDNGEREFNSNIV